MKTPLIFAIVSIAILTTGCASTTGQGGATSDELCRQWGGSLPTRSRSDTDQTKAEIQKAYATFDLACPEWAHLIP